jgi:hypothetical protein
MVFAVGTFRIRVLRMWYVQGRYLRAINRLLGILGNIEIGCCARAPSKH